MTNRNKKTTVKLVMVLLASLMLVVGSLGYLGMAKGEHGLRDTYENEVVQFIYLDEVCDVYAEEIPAICHKVLMGELSFAQAQAEMNRAITRADLAWKDYMSGRLEPKEKNRATELLALKSPLDSATRQLKDIFEKEDRARLDSFHAKDLNLATEPYCKKLNELCRLQQADAKNTVASTERTFTSMKAILVASLVASLIIAAFLTAYLLRMQANLQQSEQQFRSMFESHRSVMMLIVPSSGEIVEANPAASTFYGFSLAELQSRNARELNLLRQTKDLTQIGRNGPGKEAEDYETTTRLSSGEFRQVEVHASSIHMQGMDLLFAIIHDVSARKDLEKQLLEMGEQERWRVGLDLRDTLGGTLAGAAMGAQALLTTLSRNSLPGTELAEEVVHQLNEAVTQSRSISRGLCSTDPMGPGLVLGLKELAANVEQLWGVRCQFEVSEDLAFNDEVKPAQLFHIAQEAVNSALSHGRAKNLAIHLSQKDGQVVLKIANDGEPVPERPQISSCKEMCSMTCRANAIGGKLQFEANQKGKVLVTCTLPKEHA
jgi:PAS domain S-box-containing protein